jgi:AcrR family transcriptional regulator
MPRAGLTADTVVDVAIAILDEQGPDALALSVVAVRAGVATPSLYKHVGSLAELRSRVSVRILSEMTAAATEAVLGLSGDDAVVALMRQMRAYAVQHPPRYAHVPADPMHNPDLAAAARGLIEVFLAVLRGYDLQGSDAIHATRCLRVIVFGFSSIESSGGFGLAEDQSETYEQLIHMYLEYLHSAVSSRLPTPGASNV